MNGILQSAVHLYSLALRLYPRSYWSQYAGEMRAVFSLVVEAASRDGVLAVTRCCMREVRDLPAALYQAHQRARRTGDMSRENKSTPFLGAGSWTHALGATVPFVLVGLFAIWSARPMVWNGGWLRSLLIVLLVAGSLGALAGLVVGWAKGFPRWSYGYVLCLPFWSWYMGCWRISRQELLGWRSMIPLGVAVVVALAITRSLRPLLRLVAGVLEDWTRLSFVLYSLATWLLWVSFDEVANDHELPYAIAVNAILIAGALVYVRVAGRWRRALSLVAGFGTAWLVMTVGTASYWHGRQGISSGVRLNGFVEAAKTVAVLPIAVALLLSPALLALLAQFVRSGRQSSSV